MKNSRAGAGACVSCRLLAAGLAACAIGRTSGQEKPEVKVSQPFRYESYSPAAWKGYRRTSEFVRMPDGVKLAVDVVLPTEFQGEGSAPTRFPVIFRYTPYGRSYIDLKTGAVSIWARAEPFLSHGYAFVSADMRGTGASDGWMNNFSTVLRDDGKHLVDWIADQSWSDGKVGMIGGSYEGWSQLATASKHPKALKAIVPSVQAYDAFLNYPGGILTYAFLQTWSAFAYSVNRNAVFPPFPVGPAAPVADEDGDGQLVDEIPVDLNGNGWLHDDYRWPLERGPAPRYADGVARTHHYYLKAILQHAADPKGAPGTYDAYGSVEATPFADTKRPGDGLTAPELTWAWLPDIMASGVAVLNMGGWFDMGIRASTELHSTLAGKQPARLLVTPTYHQGISPAAAAAVGFESAGPNGLTRARQVEYLRWYDHWLKGIDNGIDREQAVLLFVMNEGWRQEKSWPPATARGRRFFLGPARRLGGQTREGDFDRYQADLTAYSGWAPTFDNGHTARINQALGRAAPVTPTFLRNREFRFGVPEGLPLRTELDRKTQCYTSAPLERDTRVIGHPIVHLWVSSTADDGDFFFYLEDVNPDGQAFLVTEYQHRAGFATLRNNDEMIPNNPGIDVKPDLPWHGFNAADYNPRIFADGKVAEIVTALYPTAWLFKKGHSVRLSIAAADWPTFSLHPALAPSNRPDGPGTIVPTITIHRGGGRASFVELPVVP